MGNKYAALLLVVCLIVGGSVDAMSDARKKCLENCHKRLCSSWSFSICQGTCKVMCVAFTQPNALKSKRLARRIQQKNVNEPGGSKQGVQAPLRA